MRTDADIKRDAEAELQWSPEIDDTGIAVTVTNGGAVALTGYACSSFCKVRAEAAVKRVAGVTAVANNLSVRKPAGGMPGDPRITWHAMGALKAALPFACDDIKLIVIGGHLALEGKVEWHYERERAEASVRSIPGVLSVRNSLRITPHVAPLEIKHQIAEAFRRSAVIDARRITVDAQGGEVTLRGEVRSWVEHDQALQSAWAAPGVSSLKNELSVAFEVRAGRPSI